MTGEKVRCVIGVVCLLAVGCAPTPVGSYIPDASTKPRPATETPVSTEDARMATAWARYRAAQTLAAQETTAPTHEPPPLPDPVTFSFPTLAPAPTPGGSLSPSGPWLVGRNLAFNSEEYLWAANPDLSGLTRLIPEPVIAYAIRPMDTIGGGLTIAYVTRPFWESVDITLKIVTLPGGEPKTIASLYQAAPGADFTPHHLEVALSGDGMVWSPDGQTLAFLGGISGLSVDLYTYSLNTGEIRQLSDGPLHAYRPRWSPDGRYILHEAAELMTMGGPYTLGMWAVPVGGGANISLAGQDSSFLTVNGPHFYGWLSPTQMLFDTTSYGKRDSIQSVNIETGAIDIILEAEFDWAAYSAEHQTWLLARTFEIETLGPALILCRGSDCRVVLSNKVWSVWWSSSRDTFFSLSEHGELYQITAEGAVTRLPIKLDDSMGVFPFVTESPDGTRWAWHWHGDMSGIPKTYLGDAMAQPHLLPIDWEMRIQQITWSPDSQHLLFFGSTDTFIASYPDFELTMAAQGWTATDISWVK